MWAEASTIYRTYAGEDAKFSENHTLESLRAVTSAASKIAIKGGTEAATAFTNYADSIIDSYPSKADEINSILQNIDWDQSGPEAMADLRM
jgi:pilus assembly protein TadC